MIHSLVFSGARVRIRSAGLFLLNKRKQISEIDECYVKKIAFFEILNIYYEKLKIEETFELVKEINPDLIVVVAYGKILPKNIQI